ncbi:MAG TPA: DUF4403 family protein [Verrucomicrobiales bacterium]|nr:DUF4403 family protein [Verrucomicrobiales bacterium]
MKTVLLILAALLLVGVLAVFLGARVLGPRWISVDAPAGTSIGELDVPRAETSLLAINIAVPVSLLNEIANAEVPATFTGTEQKEIHKRVKNGSFAWNVKRGEILFANLGDKLSFHVPFDGTANINGDIDAKIISFPIHGSVDVGGSAGGILVPEILPDWQINPNLVPNIELSKAVLSLGQIGKIDLSDLIGGSVGQYLQKETRKITPALRKGINLRKEVNKLWNQAYITRQVSESPPVWINVNPRRLLVAPIDFHAPDSLSVTVGVESETMLTNRDPGTATPAPLPDMKPLTGPVSTELNLPVIISIAELNEVIRKENIAIDTGIGTKIEISGMEAEVGEKGYLNLKLEIEADKSRLGRGVAGSIWVSGRPIINLEDQTLGFTSVELTVETKDKLTGAAAWLLEDLLVKGIESQLRVDLNEYQAELNEEVQKAIANAHLPEGIDVSLKNLQVKLTDIYTVTRPTAEGNPDPGIVIVVQATGDMSSSINQLELKPDREP